MFFNFILGLELVSVLKQINLSFEICICDVTCQNQAFVAEMRC